MNIGTIKREAKASLKNRWGLAILLTVVTYGVYTLLPIPFEIVASGGYDNWMKDESDSASWISTAFAIVFSPLLMANYWAFLGLARGESVQLGHLFKTFQDFGLYVKSLGIYVLITLYVMLWSLLLLIPGIIKALAYSQTYYICKDNPTYSMNQAITESRRLMNGYKGQYFLLLLSFLGWFLLSIITLGIGFLWSIPYLSASLARFYENLLNERSSHAE
ncbi:DUF975 family protein [Priestia megaterium]|uniref:DUF975 family protein n=1 Tax=Priestia megaterium TaxID=1404 RepID=UPI003D996A7A